MDADTKWALSVLIILALFCVLALWLGAWRHAASLPAAPDPKLTPGAVRFMTQEQICSTRWALKSLPQYDERMVDDKMKKRVGDRYNFAWADRKLVEFDHLVPRCMGGADVEDNLWPQPLAGDYNAHVKDKLERRACREVCAGRLPLQETQEAFKKDWITLYHRYYGATQ